MMRRGSGLTTADVFVARYSQVGRRCSACSVWRQFVVTIGKHAEGRAAGRRSLYGIDGILAKTSIVISDDSVLIHGLAGGLRAAICPPTDLGILALPRSRCCPGADRRRTDGNAGRVR